ncbi:MAG: DUF58 domain-containing protein [Phycisphaerales bacterium]|nr:MAG: DUF58 domain-containing protein [Phycisphaerales bacterium]
MSEEIQSPVGAGRVRQLRFRPRRRVEEMLAGSYLSAYKGEGLEFAEVRAYEPGDDVRSIDWNVTARTGTPFVKRFVEERRLTVMLLVDISASESFGTAGRPKREAAAEVASLLASAAGRSHDRVGLLLFSDRAELYIPPGKSRQHRLRIERALRFHKASGRGTDIDAAIRFLGAVRKRRAMVFLISDFLAPTESYKSALNRLSRRHEVTAVRVEDPKERTLPRVGLIRLRDAETGRQRVLDLGRSASKRYKEEWRRRRIETDSAFMSAGASLVDITTDTPAIDPLSKHFRARSRR